MIVLVPHANGVILPVRAQPGARRNAVTGTLGGALKVAVTAAPERGKANKAIIKLLAETLDCKRGQITLLSGETGQDKRFLIRDVTSVNLQTRLNALL